MRIAVIPARGGSKRIPGKNLRPFAGRPIIEWPIAKALSSGVFSRVIVSTDDDAIAAAASAAGAEVPFRRPAPLADDMATTSQVMRHAADWIGQQKSPVTAICCIYPTAALIQVPDLIEGAALIDQGQWDFVFSAAPIDGPLLRSFVTTPEGGVRMLFPEHASARSQDLPEVLQDAGQFYWGTPAAWLEQRPIFQVASRPLVLSASRVQDIDTEADWVRAERIFRALEPGATT